jgi:ech hydrogenase subunit D
MSENNKKGEAEFVQITATELVEKVQDLLADGYRLGQACCTEIGNEFELMYSFDKDYNLLNLQFRIPKGEEVMSITNVCWSAFIYENEIQDLFGIKFKHSVLDYGGHFFKLHEPTPWNTKNIDQ